MNEPSRSNATQPAAAVPEAPRSLTAGEERIALLAARGRRNGEIAAALELSPKTVEWNLTRVYRKLGVRSRTELANRLTSGDSPWAAEQRK